MTPRYVLRWHKRTSWRRCGTELGAIDLGAELHCVHETCLAQSVKHKALNLVVVGSSHMVGVFLIHTFCLCHWFVFFCCPDFSFMSLICPSRFFLFLWPICLFVQVFFLYFLSLSLICFFCCPDFSFMSLICPSRFFCFCDWFVYSSKYFFCLSGEHSGCVPQWPRAVNFPPYLLT
jgi:hypothetical protein